MRKNKYFWAILGIIILSLLYFLWRTGCLEDTVRYQIERTFFSVFEERLCIEKDIDADGLKEQIKFVVIRFPSRAYYKEGFIEVYKSRNKMFQSDKLGNELEMADVSDINRDGNIDIVSKWAEGNARAFYIYSFTNVGFKELLWASGQDVVICDLEKDGTKEVVEYWRDQDKTYNDFVATIYKWSGKEYILIKEGIPIKIDPAREDRLFLGKGKVVVIK